MSPKRIIFSLNSLFIGIGFLFAGNALIISSLGVILRENNTSSFMIGLVSAFFYLGAMSATFFAQNIIAKIGHIRAFGIFSTGFGICVLLHTMSENLAFWSFLRFIIGACYYALLIIIESWINEKARNAVRSRVLSFYEIVFYTAFGLGILLIALNLDKISIFIIAASLILFSSLPLNLIKIKQPLLPKPSKISIPKLYDIAPLAVLTAFVAGMLINGFFSMSALFMILQGFEAKNVAYFMFFGMCGGFIAQLFVGKISDHLGRKFAIILCAIIGLVASAFFVLFTPNLLFQYALAVVLGIGIFCLYALALARANDVMSEKKCPVELGRGVLFCYSLGSLLAPLILGVLMQFLGAFGFVYFFMASLALLLLFSLNKPNILGAKFKNRFKALVGEND